MDERCSICGKLLTAKDNGQFFPEDDSYICRVCQKKHILVIEGEKSLRQLYTIELEAEGYDVVTSASGREALEKLKHEPIDLVLLELILPDGSGLEYLQHFLEVNRKAKVIINSAYPVLKRDFRSWAADAFLTKSSDLTELKNIIDGILLLNRNDRQSRTESQSPS